jgi:hypothetical protein
MRATPLVGCCCCCCFCCRQDIAVKGSVESFRFDLVDVARPVLADNFTALWAQYTVR